MVLNVEAAKKERQFDDDLEALIRELRNWSYLVQDDRSRAEIWNMLPSEGWLTGSTGGISTFLREKGKPSKRWLQLGSMEVSATLRFTELTRLYAVELETQLPQADAKAGLQGSIRAIRDGLIKRLPGSRSRADPRGLASWVVVWMDVAVWVVVAEDDPAKLVFTVRHAPPAS